MPSLLDPASVAVIGASTDKKKIGYLILENLVKQGYEGTVYPVNPKGGTILKKKAYPSVKDIPKKVEMAVIVTPAATVPALVEECAEKGVETVVVISAGFGEIGTEEGHEREQEIAAIAERHGIRLIGPNCLGILRPSLGMNASFALTLPPAGNIALFSQSGALAVAVMDASPALRLGYSAVVSMGNKAVLDECDFLETAEQDDATRVIGLYLESIKDGARFRKVATRVAASKPIVLIKSGTSVRGGKAVSSHTGSLAGLDSAIDAMCLQTGIRRAKSYEEFLDMLRVLSMCPTLLTPRIAVVTNAGGPGVLATDAAEREHLQLAMLAEKTTDSLRSSLPGAASTGNPVDVLGDADETRYRDALDACAQDPDVDGIAVIVTPQVMTPVRAIAEATVKAARATPLIPVVASIMGDESVQEGIAFLHTHNVPNFRSPEAAIRALSTLRKTEGSPYVPSEKSEEWDDRSSAARDVLRGVTGLLDELTLQDLFALYGLPVPEQGIADTADEAVSIAKEIGFPVIAKISSPDILHKTDVGGVGANLKNVKEVEAAFADIMRNVAEHAPAAGINGVLIQKYLPVGQEFIVGAIRDDAFGPLVMAGLGGIYTELVKDTAFRLAPLNESDAYAMLQDLKSWKLLLGMRGKGQLDIAALVQLILTVGNLMTDCPQIGEVDLNPVLLKEKGLVIADAKVVITETTPHFLRPERADL